jgi:hypothetical protein
VSKTLNYDELLITKKSSNRAKTAKTSPRRTPTKKQTSKMQPLLDPSRLKPPTQMLPQEIRNSQLNLSIGLQHQQQQQQQQDENEILSISHIEAIPKIEML